MGPPAWIRCAPLRADARYTLRAMTDENSRSLAAFARDVAQACRSRTGFEATQTIEAGPIRIVAKVRAHRLGTLAVEYRTYTNPLLDVEEELTGDAEYTADELAGLSIHYDGSHTWCYDAASDVCLVKESRALYEPLPEMDLLGEIGYLRDLPHDYLLRDAGSETIDGRDTRILSLKPKRAHHAHAFKLIAYLATTASVALDRETLFPARLVISPMPSTQTAQLLGPAGRVTVRYEGLRLLDDPPAAFSPPAETRVFRETTAPLEDLPARLTFPFDVGPIRAAGFDPIDDRARLAVDEQNGRSYAVATFVRSSEPNEQPSEAITVRCGDYLSRNMARRRIRASEDGEEVTLAGHAVRFFDRGPQWENAPAGLDAARAPNEISWERQGVFWFLIGLSADRAVLEEIASALVEIDAAPEAA